MRAAQILGCSYLELRDAPDKGELMRIAFTYERGTNDGEYLRECNPAWHKKRKNAQTAIEKASK